jgi:predicted DNA-binding ribbon-helix-helix protein
VKIVEKENQPKPDKRTLNKTGRIHQLGTRVRKEFLKKLRKIARQEKLKYVEVLERALDCYEAHRKSA